MKERAFFFGEPKTLFGIVTEPAAPAPGRPAVLVLNSGVVHRVGPYRNSVKIARRLAAAGFLTLRFDLSGIGDSEPRRDTASFEERWVADTRQAMDHLAASRGVDRFVLLGLCSGADNSLQTARRDERVAGAIMMDGYAYRTPGFYLRYYGRRARKVDTWVRLGRRTLARAEDRVRRLIGGGAAAAAVDAAPAGGAAQYERTFPPRDEVAGHLRAMVGRGVHLYFIYSSGMTLYYNYREQLADAFGDVDFRDRLTVDFFAGADHTFTELDQQRALIDAIAGWVERTFSAAPSGPR